MTIVISTACASAERRVSTAPANPRSRLELTLPIRRKKVQNVVGADLDNRLVLDRAAIGVTQLVSHCARYFSSRGHFRKILDFRTAAGASMRFPPQRPPSGIDSLWRAPRASSACAAMPSAYGSRDRIRNLRTERPFLNRDNHPWRAGLRSEHRQQVVRNATRNGIGRDHVEIHWRHSRRHLPDRLDRCDRTAEADLLDLTRHSAFPNRARLETKKGATRRPFCYSGRFIAAACHPRPEHRS